MFSHLTSKNEEPTEGRQLSELMQ